MATVTATLPVRRFAPAMLAETPAPVLAPLQAEEHAAPVRARPSERARADARRRFAAAAPVRLAYTAAVTTPPTAAAPAAQLRQGAQGPAVAQMQEALRGLGYNVGPIDGDFGPMTANALRAFQRDHGLTVDATYGPQTRAAMDAARRPAPAPAAPAPVPSAPAPAPSAAAVPQSSLRRGSHGEDVKLLQAALQSLGYSVGPIDGDFGPMTEAALKAFQRDRGIVVDGRYGPQSRGALSAALNGAPAPAPLGPTAPTGPTAPIDGPRAERINGMLDWAKGEIGTPYAAVNPFRFGTVPWDGGRHQSVNGSGTWWQYPAGTKVYDCSGFVCTAYKQLGVDLAARGLSTSGSIAADRTFLQDVPRDQLQPGDLITYSGHVMIYMGDGKVIDSSGSKGVAINNVDWSRVTSCKRVPLP